MTDGNFPENIAARLPAQIQTEGNTMNVQFNLEDPKAA